MSYLRLPLKNKKSTRRDYIILIKRIEKKLLGWKAQVLLKDIRFILVNVVLLAILVYFMLIFLLPWWVLCRIDRICRRFLWHDHKEANVNKRQINLANWNLIIRHKSLRGLRIKDIKAANQAWMLKHMWSWWQNDQKWWKNITEAQTHTLNHGKYKGHKCSEKIASTFRKYSHHRLFSTRGRVQRYSSRMIIGWM
jgi:hypothetical protein